MGLWNRTEKRYCDRCGQEFIARTYNKIFCSRKCQQKAQMESRKTSLPLTRPREKNRIINDPVRKLMAAIFLRATLDLREKGCLNAYEWMYSDAPFYADVMGFESDVRRWAQERLMEYNYGKRRKVMVSRGRDGSFVRITVS